MQLVVIGDVGGHLDELQNALRGVGVDIAERHIPNGVTVVQVGDLIHRGPDSSGVVALVDEMMANNGERWVQLLGNHEAQYVHREAFAWHEELDLVSQRTLRRWVDDGSMRLAFSCDTAGVSVRRSGGRRETIGAGGLLVTHAGLTAGCWEALGSPMTAKDAAEAVNNGASTMTSPVWNQGRMIEGHVCRDAGVVWAAAGDELLGGWLDAAEQVVRMPFHQAHGHSTAYWWNRGSWMPPKLESVLDGCSHLNSESRIVRVEVADAVVWGVDPAHGAVAAPRWAPLLLEM